MIIKEICDLWIDYAYDHWVEKWVRVDSKSCLRDSTRNIVDRMKLASSDSDRAEEAWNLLERLKRLSDGFNHDDVTNEPKYKYEKPEVYMECALVAYKLGDLQEALNLLRVSIGDFSKRTLHKSISYWLCGCIQWQLPSHLEDAVLSWERSMQIINEVGIDKSNNDYATKKKCDEVAKVMRDAINESTRSNMPPPPPVPGVRSKFTPSASNFSAYEAKLKFIPFYGSIPAGDPARALEYPIGSAGVSILEIENNCFYKIFNIRQEKEIRLNLNSGYFMLKADGDSMNMANPVNIDSGDYVLLAKKMPQNNDIVAAVIVKEDVNATLKRYRIENGIEKFVSESDKSNIQIRKSKEDYIQGVVLAILKPNDDR